MFGGLKFYFLLLFILIGVDLRIVSAAEFSSLRGININLALESERYWRVRPVHNELSELRQIGFNAIRLPLKLPIGAKSDELSRRRYFSRVREVTKMAKDLGFFVVVDLHDKDIARDISGVGRDKAIEFWLGFLQEPQFSEYVDMIEPLNEPFGADTRANWAKTQFGLVELIRKKSPRLGISVTGAKWGEYESLSEISVPNGYRNIAMNFHYYAPMEFTHYRAPWVSDYLSRGSTVWDVDRVRRDFSRIGAWAQASGYPLYLGEFGVFHSHGDDVRAEWIRFVRDSAERNSIGWFYWSHVDDFGVYDIPGNCWREVLVKALGLRMPAQSKVCKS